MKSNQIFCSGNEALAAGLRAAGTTLVVGYPGTPSTEIIQTLKNPAPKTSTHSSFPVRAHWAVNEKVAFEMALGAALSGARAAVTMKHVGLNAAADPLMTSAYAGVNGGFVIITVDDPNMYSSQNEQDNRHYALFAKLPMLEPSDGNEAFLYTQLAFILSEKFNTPVILRLTMRVSHSYGIVETFPNESETLTAYFPPQFPYPPNETSQAFNKHDPRTIMLPSIGRLRHKLVEERIELLEQFSNLAPLHQFTPGQGKTLIVTAGVSYHYLQETFTSLPIFKLGMSYPIPAERIKTLAKDFEEVVVIEELDPFMERELLVQGLPYAKLRKRSRSFYLGELSPERTIALLRHNHETLNTSAPLRENPEIRPNPPRLCSGCPHLTISNLLRELDMTVSGDIGCYTLAALEPFNSLHTVIDMGASIPIMLGMQMTAPPQPHTAPTAPSAPRDTKTASEQEAAKPIAIDSTAPLPLSFESLRRDTRARIAVIGDSTFVHSGITGLLEASTLSPDGVICLLDNRTTAMTGQQAHAGNPATTPDHPPKRKVDYLKLANALGIAQAYKCDPYDLKTSRALLQRALKEPGISFIIFERACALLKTPPTTQQATPTTQSSQTPTLVTAPTAITTASPQPSTSFTATLPKRLQSPAEVNSNCVKCGECLRVGCPSIHFNETLGRPQIDATTCIGCGICLDVCEHDALLETQKQSIFDYLNLSTST